MPKMTPRQTDEITAIRLRKDLLGEKGQWLVIHADESLEVLDERKLLDRYRSVDSTPRPRLAPTSKLVRAARGPVNRVEINGKAITVSPQISSVLYTMASVGSQVRTADLSSRLPEVKNVAAALDYAKKLGFVDLLAKSEGIGQPAIWGLNNNGREIVRQINAGV